MRRYIYKIWGTFKYIIALILVKTICRGTFFENIWLICEKKTEARDNGYHLFKYLRLEHKEINAFYVITPDSADLPKIRNLNNIVYFNSMKHYLFFAASKYSISSQPDGSHPDMIGHMEEESRKKKITVFLQHGIIKDEISHHFDARISHYDLFSTSSKREREFIIKTYGYTINTAKLLGMCRFDSLYNISPSKRIVLVMPTFRKWLVSNNCEAEATDAEKKRFVQSDFYLSYAALLSNEKLRLLLKKNGYCLIFYLHYSFQSYTKVFLKYENNQIIIADRNNFDVQQLLIDSSIMITDFSSVFFDFAYMNKPEIYFQFDEKKYRESHYKNGYFSYDGDGFGPVVRNVYDVIRELTTIIDNHGYISELYQKRIDEFFDLRDNQNCKRTYMAIQKLIEKVNM